MSITGGLGGGVVTVVLLGAAGTLRRAGFAPRGRRETLWPHTAPRPSQTKTLLASGSRTHS